MVRQLAYQVIALNNTGGTVSQKTKNLVLSCGGSLCTADAPAIVSENYLVINYQSQGKGQQKAI